MGFGPSGLGLAQLHAKGRTHFEIDKLGATTSVLRWSDNLPLIVERTVGRGQVTAVGLPFGPAWSDLPLRPALLSLLSTMAHTAKARGAPRVEVGQSWVLDNDAIEVRSAEGRYPFSRSPGKARITPHRAGRYDIRIGEEVESRFASIPSREVDFRPRAVAASSQDPRLGTTSTPVDISRWIALALLALLAMELGVRTLIRTRSSA